MRLCRFRRAGEVAVGFYGDDHVVPIAAALKAYNDVTREAIALSLADDDLLPLLPAGEHFATVSRLAGWVERQARELPAEASVPSDAIELLVPIAAPKKIFLLAGNYSQHIEEGGGIAPERTETFPYVFMKPPTTLADPGKVVEIPKVSPAAIDWELELAVVIGRTVKHATAADALESVAGYTVVNDISNRRFRPNPERKERPKDTFFDWLHGKWFDSFCPMGPCITSADAIPDPQKLDLQLRLNGEVRQDSSTATQIFSVAEVIEFITQIVTLEPGDIISTGTPAGVGSASGTFLKPGDNLAATISQIGTLTSPVVAEA